MVMSCVLWEEWLDRSPMPGPAGATAGSAPAASSTGGPSSASGAAAPAPVAGAGEQPERGGELTFVVGAEPPSFDAHREATFAMIHPTAPHYSLLLKFDPENYPNIVGDVAQSWTVSPDGL